ncbi:MAG: T9SS type A sorting domain-containing protein [Bacteroidales bacterium]|jgi:hypothetical protein|nr:T9SS type A sorting domain-containing protein [Bacteroidales bacterium]
MKIKITFSLLTFLMLSSVAQNQWSGSSSSDFYDVENWDPIEGSVPVSMDSYKECRIGQATVPPVYNSNGKFFVIKMEEGGHLTVTNLLYADKLFATMNVTSDIIVKDGGIINVRNANSSVQGGTITVLDGGRFECKSSINFIWGRWDSDDCTFNLLGGTADFTQFVPFRNGYINSAKIVCAGGGVGTFTGTQANDWASNGKIIPAEGSVLVYDENTTSRLSSIDLVLPVDTAIAITGGKYSLPDYFELYATGDTANAAEVTITQTPAAGTEYFSSTVVNVKVSVIDYFGNTLLDTLELTLSDVATALPQHKNQSVILSSTSDGLILDVDNTYRVTIYTLSGKIVKTFKANKGLTNINLAQGFYLVNCVNGDCVYTTKISIK